MTFTVSLKCTIFKNLESAPLYLLFFSFHLLNTAGLFLIINDILFFSMISEIA